MRRQRLLPLLALAITCALLLWTLLGWQPEQPATQDNARVLPAGGDFTLQTANGPLSLHDFRGKVVLLYFGYTSCPDVCPTSLTLMRIALAQLNEAELSQVRGIFISVDPQRDTPERLAQYSSHFHANIAGVTGNEAEIAAVARRYGAIYQRVEGESALGYSVDHSSVTYVIDQQGKLVSTLPHGASPERILEAIRRLLGTTGQH